MLLAEGAEILSVGAVLSTVKVLLGPAAAALLPRVSEAVAAAREIPTAPSPLQELRVTVLVVVPLPLTAEEQLAVPPALTVTLAFTRLTVSALL